MQDSRPALLKRALRIVHVLARVRQALQAAQDAALPLRARNMEASPLDFEDLLNPITLSSKGRMVICGPQAALHRLVPSSVCRCFLPERFIRTWETARAWMMRRRSCTRIVGVTSTRKGPPLCRPAESTVSPYSSTSCCTQRFGPSSQARHDYTNTSHCSTTLHYGQSASGRMLHHLCFHASAPPMQIPLTASCFQGSTAALHAGQNLVSPAMRAARTRSLTTRRLTVGRPAYWSRTGWYPAHADGLHPWSLHAGCALSMDSARSTVTDAHTCMRAHHVSAPRRCTVRGWVACFQSKGVLMIYHCRKAIVTGAVQQGANLSGAHREARPPHMPPAGPARPAPGWVHILSSTLRTTTCVREPKLIASVPASSGRTRSWPGKQHKHCSGPHFDGGYESLYRISAAAPARVEGSSCARVLLSTQAVTLRDKPSKPAQVLVPAHPRACHPA